MRTLRSTFGVGLLIACAAFGQAAKKSFEVASIKTAAPLDVMKMAQAMQQGGAMPKIGAKVDGARAEYTYMALKDLIVTAYKVKAYQITGPDWMANQRFDIVAKMPDGATKDDAPEMLQSLLEERFKLAIHRENKEHPVLALLAGKGPSKLVSSGDAPAPIDENAPLKPGETKMDTAEGQVRMSMGKNGTIDMNMGAKGSMKMKVDTATMSLHMDADRVTMDGFAEMLTQFSSLTGGGPQVVDMTGIKGNYQVSLDISLTELLAMAKAAGMDIPANAQAAIAGPAGAGAVAASDPSGGSSLYSAVANLGLKLESRKAPTEQLIVDHLEKAPTEN